MRTIHIMLSVLCLGITLGAAGPSPAQELGETLNPVPDRPPAPDFELRDMEGKVHRLADYRGKVLIVNFWATWCPPCRKEMPSMQRAWKQLRDEGVEMVAINVGEDEDTIFSSFLADHPVEFPLLLDEDSSVTTKWPVVGLPTTYVVDPDGHLVYQAVGGREWDHPAVLEQVRALRRPGPAKPI